MVRADYVLYLSSYLYNINAVTIKIYKIIIPTYVYILIEIICDQ